MKPGPRFGVVALGIFALLALVAYPIWHWEVDRVEVGPGEFLVLVSSWGTNLGENEIVAPDTSYKGVMLKPLSEGRHFYNPLFWERKIYPMVSVPPGQCLVLTRKFGQPIPVERQQLGDILAHENAENPIEGERGILREVRLPGSYRINPYAYDWLPVPAVEIQVNQIGVRTLKVGNDPQKMTVDPTRGNYVVDDGFRGVQRATVPPGTYYINPYVESIIPVDVRSHRVELTDITFPSRDGFILKPHVLVEYAVQPDRAPEMLVRLTDDGIIHQEDSTPEEKQGNEILQKVILPHIRGYCRLEGSNFDARDFIVTVNDKDPNKTVNAREVLQKALLEKVKPRCEELGVEIRAVTLADMLPPAELAEQIAQRELARVELEKNQAQMRQYKGQQELRAKEALQQQAKEKVEAETRLIQAKTRADQLSEVETSRLKQDLANADIRLEAGRKQAEAMLTKGKGETAVITQQNEAEVSGLSKAVQGFGSIHSFAQYHIVSKLAPALNEVFASDEGDFAKIFSGFLSPPNGETPAAKPPATAE